MSIDKYSVREIVAYHEAGHAVIAWFLSVQILEMGFVGIRGYVRDAMRWEAPKFMSHSNAEKHAHILLGGEMAERILYELDDSEYDFVQSMAYGTNGDRGKVEELAEYFYGKEAAKWINDMEVAVNKILLNNWSRVEALANTFSEMGFLLGQDAELIIGDAVHK